MRRKLGNKLDESELTEVCKMIMATRIPQTPLDHLGEIILRCRSWLPGARRLSGNKRWPAAWIPAIWNCERRSGLGRKANFFLKHHTYFTDNSKQLRQSVKKTTWKNSTKSFSKGIHKQTICGVQLFSDRSMLEKKKDGWLPNFSGYSFPGCRYYLFFFTSAITTFLEELNPSKDFAHCIYLRVFLNAAHGLHHGILGNTVIA